MVTINLDEMGKLLYNVCSREKHKTTKRKEVQAMNDIMLELDKLNKENLKKFKDYLETFSPVCPKDSADISLLVPAVPVKDRKIS